MVSVTVTTVAPLVMLQNAPGFVALRFAPVRCAFGGSGVGGLMTLNLRQFPTWNFTMSHQQFFRGSKMRILFGYRFEGISAFRFSCGSIQVKRLHGIFVTRERMPGWFGMWSYMFRLKHSNSRPWLYCGRGWCCALRFSANNLGASTTVGWFIIDNSNWKNTCL